jgi:hypothetical protein
MSRYAWEQGGKIMTAKQQLEGIPGRSRWIGEAADPVAAAFLLVLAAAAIVGVVLANQSFHGDHKRVAM